MAKVMAGGRTWARFRRRPGAISPASTTTRRCAAPGPWCPRCASAPSRARTRACSCATTSSSCTRRGSSASISRGPSAAWSCPSSPWWTSWPSSGAAAPPPRGTSGTWARITGSSRSTTPRPSTRSGTPIPTRSWPPPSRSPPRAGPPGRRRLRGQRPLAVFLRRRQLRVEHARRHRLRRRRQDAPRLAPVPGAQGRLRDHRHVAGDGDGRHGQQGHRGDGALRARAPRPAARALPRRARAPGGRAPLRRALPHSRGGLGRTSPRLGRARRRAGRL